MEGALRDNAALGRFELDFDDGQGFVTYRRAGNVVTLLHAEVPSAVAGHGHGSALVRATLEHLRAENARIVPVCTFIVRYLERHPEYRGLLA
ncbi:MAG: N-acetyltransferase [Gammaproteobacteria bacterium]|nr:N-acetyltransferase [Gammaproteobacteria bacterium]